VFAKVLLVEKRWKMGMSCVKEFLKVAELSMNRVPSTT
jgi:hypothetical protein